MDAKYLILVLAVSFLLSGCVDDNDAALNNVVIDNFTMNNGIPESPDEDTEDISFEDLAPLSKDEIKLEYDLISFSMAYMRHNSYLEERYVFSWDNVPGNESDRLLDFLKEKSRHHWLLYELILRKPSRMKSAQIVKSEENSTIRILIAQDSIEIKLENNTANIYADGRAYGWPENVSTYSLITRQENGTLNAYFREFKNRYDLVERYYAIYDLSIKNNGSSTFDYISDELKLQVGSQVYNATVPEYDIDIWDGLMKNIQAEKKLEDARILPGQTVKGTVAFRVNSWNDSSFLLMYNRTPIALASFNKSFEALTKAELFDYYRVFGVPPYTDIFAIENISSHDPMKLESVPGSAYPHIWSNWVNRSVFEFFKQLDTEHMMKSHPEDVPYVNIVYASKVMPAENITVLPGNYLLVINDMGEELINNSWRRGNSEIAVLTDQTYGHYSGIDRMMKFSNSTVVRSSFHNEYGWSMATRFNLNEQDIILDDKMNVVIANTDIAHFVS